MENLIQDQKILDPTDGPPTQLQIDEAQILDLIPEVESETVEERKTRRTTLY